MRRVYVRLIISLIWCFGIMGLFIYDHTYFLTYYFIMAILTFLFTHYLLKLLPDKKQ